MGVFSHVDMRPIVRTGSIPRWATSCNDSRVRPSLFVAIVLVACGGSSASTSGPPRDAGVSDGDIAPAAALPDGGNASPEAGIDAGLDPACAPAYPAPDGNCKLGTTCRYPEGTCTCAQRCSGAPPAEDIDTSQWYCVPKRTDGCPDDAPMEGAPCTGRATCQYGSCCVTRFTCDGATWSSRLEICPG
jgi:hypothetical protein